MSLLKDAVPIPGTRNVAVALDGSKLWIFCDLAKNYGSSTSGKTIVVASSSGNKALGSTNAYLGLNIFCKSEQDRKLESSATAGLSELVEVGTHCKWRVEENVLCILIDFDDVGDKVGTTGKSVLLASSSGNKVIGKTGIMCGLNCYIPVGKPLQVDKLRTILSSVVAPDIGDVVEIGDGFTLSMESATQATIHYEFAHRSTTGTTTMPSFSLGGETTIALLLKQGGKKRPRGEQDNATDTTTSTNEFVELSTKSKNLYIRFQDKKDDKHVLVIDLRFDPTQNLGRSSSGKSLTVASSGGWCEVGGGLFSLSFNAYKPAPPLTAGEIGEAVAKVLDPVQEDGLMSLSFKAVLADVLVTLGLKEGTEIDVRNVVKDAVKNYIQVRGVNLSSQT